MRQQPEQQAPPVQRLRIRYARRGRLRFTSHRDFSRAFERALVRARIPMAYSSGFHPHPRISYAGGAPTGTLSEAEFLEIGLSEVVDPLRVHADLDAALPDGLDVLEVVPSAGGSLTERLEASQWSVRLPDVSAAAASRAAESFLATPEVMVERMTKKGLRRFDAREAVVHLVVTPGEDPVATGLGTGPGTGAGPTAGATHPENDPSGAPCAILQMVLRHGSPSVRPDDVLAALGEIGGLSSSVAAVQQRVAQGPIDPAGSTVGDPLAPDRDAAR